jgi:hypothetical protein
MSVLSNPPSIEEFMATSFCEKCKENHPGRACDYADGECAETKAEDETPAQPSVPEDSSPAHPSCKPALETTKRLIIKD